MWNTTLIDGIPRNLVRPVKMCSRICVWKKLSHTHMYSVQNSPSKEMLFLHSAQFYFMLTAGLYEDIEYTVLSALWHDHISAVYSTLCSLTWPHYCSIQYSLLSDMTTFLSHIADIPGCILCKWVRAHGDSSNSISETWWWFGTSFCGIRKFVTMFTRACL